MKSLFIGLVAFAACGCALTSKAEVADIRYFSPERSVPTLTSAQDVQTASALELRLGKVTSGPHLRERIAYREPGHEIGYYDDRRWTERPDAYVRRALERRLFEEGGFRRVLGGPVPVLDVEVISFDEVRDARGRSARVSLRIVLSQDRVVVREDTITIDVPVARTKDPGVDEVVAALSTALDFATAQVAARAHSSLQR
jgi:cholesterol transport system auxiliary component